MIPHKCLPTALPKPTIKPQRPRLNAFVHSSLQIHWDTPPSKDPHQGLESRFEQTGRGAKYLLCQTGARWRALKEAKKGCGRMSIDAWEGGGFDKHD